MHSEQMPPFSVAIGGLGGSGTRVVAQILRKMGFYLGPALNSQLDNLLFTLLFKRRDWIHSFPTDAEIDRMAAVFEKAMREGVKTGFDQLAPGEIENLLENSRGLGVSPAAFDAILTSPPPRAGDFTGLAWKEPNTHVFLPQLMQRFPDMKYIHVIRNGLDMALSGNRQQLINWGSRYGVHAAPGDASPQTQLRYWLAANRTIIEFGNAMQPQQFFLLNYDALCLSFETEVARLQTFLQRQLTQADIAYFHDHIAPESIGRFRKAPANTFSSAEREAVQQLGFCVD